MFKKVKQLRDALIQQKEKFSAALKIDDIGARITELLKLKKETEKIQQEVENEKDRALDIGLMVMSLGLGGIGVFGSIIACAVFPPAIVVPLVFGIYIAIKGNKICNKYNSHSAGATALCKAIDEQAAKTYAENPAKALAEPAIQNMILTKMFNQQNKDSTSKLDQLDIFKPKADQKLVA